MIFAFKIREPRIYVQNLEKENKKNYKFKSIRQWNVTFYLIQREILRARKEIWHMQCLCEFSPKRANSLKNIKLEIKVSGIHPIGFLVLAERETESGPNFRLPLSRSVFWGDFSQHCMMMIFLIDIFSASTELIMSFLFSSINKY